jgi:hypothetical protein
MTEVVQPTPAGTKTLGVALPDELHAQFVMVAGLKGLSLKEAVRQAVESWIEQGRTELAERAHEAMAEIEAEAAQRRAALTSLFGPQAPGPEASGASSEPDKPTSRRSTKEQTP